MLFQKTEHPLADVCQLEIRDDKDIVNGRHKILVRKFFICVTNQTHGFVTEECQDHFESGQSPDEFCIRIGMFLITRSHKEFYVVSVGKANLNLA